MCPHPLGGVAANRSLDRPVDLGHVALHCIRNRIVASLRLEFQFEWGADAGNMVTFWEAVKENRQDGYA